MDSKEREKHAENQADKFTHIHTHIHTRAHARTKRKRGEGEWEYEQRGSSKLSYILWHLIDKESKKHFVKQDDFLLLI